MKSRELVGKGQKQGFCGEGHWGRGWDPVNDGLAEGEI